MKSTATNKTKKVRVIPGYHLTLGITVTMLSLIVLIPLASVMVSALKLRPAEFWSLITKPTVRNAFATSIGCSFIAALINSVFGVIIAWVLVRYEFPGKRILDGCIELPFALPTSVAGITLSKMYSENGILGTPLAKLGIKVSYTHLGLVIALVFVGIPFVIRAVQPVLEKLDGQYEEAAFMLGANRFQTFRRVLLPFSFLPSPNVLSPVLLKYHNQSSTRDGVYCVLCDAATPGNTPFPSALHCSDSWFPDNICNRPEIPSENILKDHAATPACIVRS